MDKKFVKECPVCGSKGKSEVLKKLNLGNFGDSILQDSYEIVNCEICGFCYANTMATMEDYDLYYQNANVYSGSPHKKLQKKSDFNHIIETMNKFLKYENQILDIGCGYGDFVIEARNYGYSNILAIDPSTESIRHLVNKKITGIIGSIYDEPSKELKGKLDGVFLMDVLEHLLIPREGIKQAIKYLKEDGKLFIQVPDYEKMKDNLTPVPNNFNCEHINYFSNKSLNSLLSKFGFEEIFAETRCSNNSYKEYVLFCIYQKSKKSVEIEKDNFTKESIIEYFEKQTEIEKLRIEKIDSIKNSMDKIMIWGAGAFVSNLLVNTSLGKCNIIAFIDNNPLKIGKLFNGKRIVAPESLKNTDSTIVITSMLYGKDIELQIKNMNLKNKVILLY